MRISVLIKNLGLIAATLVCVPLWGALNVSLTVQEALYSSGTPGLARTNEPFCMGVPLADSANITSTSALALSGASAGQFRMLGVWPSGHYKWVEVCGIVPSMNAGGSANVTLTDGGSGNFGGANLAADNGATITVSTGIAVFSIKKSNFNGFDAVDVGATHVVTSSQAGTRGFILTGPDPTAAFPGNATCLPTAGGTACTTIYSSANDPNSSCAIEKNGPVQAVLKCTYDHVDAAGHVYMHGTARMYFYQGKTNVKVTSVLRNADYGTSNTFQTAFKGHRGYEFRVSPNISGTLNYSIGNESGTPTTGTMSGSDDVYLYQGQSTLMQFEDNTGGGVVPYTPDTGYKLVKNGSTLRSGNATQSPQGWCDISDGNGAGIEIGVNQFSAFWPKGCEFKGSPVEVRIGILPPQNSIPYYMEWPAWNELTNMFVEFHATNPSSLSADFLKFQHYLVARPSPDYVNSTSVFPHPIVSAAEEDTFETNVFTSASPATIPNGWSSGNVTKGSDSFLPGSNPAPNVVRDFSWNLEGEYRWGYMMTWLQRGWTAHWLEAAHWYQFQAEYMSPHSDGFDWRDHGPAGIGEINGFGMPTATSANGSLGLHSGASQIFANHDWHDQEHNHWYGQMDYYFLSGDEFQKDALIDQQKDWFLLTNSYQDGGSSTSTANSDGSTTIYMTCCGAFTSAMIGQVVLIGSTPKVGYTVASVTDSSHAVMTTAVPAGVNQRIVWDNGLYNTRAVASQLLGAGRYSAFLQSIGDSDYAGVRQQGINIFNEQVKSEACVSGFPGGCDPGTYNNASTWRNQGVSRKRGLHWGNQGGSGTWCGISQNYRVNSAFQNALLAEALLEFRNLLGPTWNDYWTASDLAYGIAQWGLTEGFVDDHSGRWDVNGFRFGVALDVPNNCLAPGDIFTVTTVAGSRNVVNAGAKPFNTSWDIGTTTAPGRGGLFQINGVSYVVSSVSDPNHLTLSTSAASSGTFAASMQEFDYMPMVTLTTFMHFYAKNFTDGSTDWAGAAKISMQKMMAAQGTSNRDFQGYHENRVISLINNPGKTLTPLPISNFTANGGGSYTISWTTPASTDYLRVKYAPTPIVDWIGFDPGTNAFTGDSSQTAWFAASNVNGIPQAIAGAQSMTINAGLTGLTAANFSVKAFTGGGSGSAPGPAPGAASAILLVSGSAQSGTGGQLLANPFVVKVTDSNGNGISGVAVTFAVTSGGGTLSATSVATNSLGTASSTLTLGAVAGANTVTASAVGLVGNPITFAATGVPATGTATNLVLVSGNNQSGTAGQPLANPLVVKANDANGNPVSGVTVTFAVTAGGGSVTATAVPTNSVGQASSNLTLGASGGTNTVTASAAGLTGSTFIFTATGAIAATPAPGGTGVTWTLQNRTAGWPSYVGWMSPQYDPVSQQTIVYAGPPGAMHGIYSTDVYAYDSAANVFTHIGGTGSSTDLCPADTPTQPGDRHPGWQMTVDSKRSMMWLFGGVNGACNGSYVSASGTSVTLVSGSDFVADGSWNNASLTLNGTTYTVASVTDKKHLTLTGSVAASFSGASNILMTLASPNTNPRLDMYYLKLNSNPVNNAWHQVTPAHLPASANSTGAMVYDADDDVLYMFGYDGAAGSHNNFVYCRTLENPSPGTATAKQLAAGCVTPDDWHEVTPAGGVQPPGSYFPGMVYDTANRKVILYGGGLPNGTTFFNQTWTYDVPSHTWTQKAISTTAPPVYTGGFTAQPAMVYNSATNRVMYHQTSGAGAPADWEYDAAADTWTKLSAGAGAASDQVLAYDAANARLVGWSLNSSSGYPQMWLGTLSSTSSSNRCDLNGDGAINAIDVQTTINQALGACGNADLNGDGACNVIDVQRVINASLGGACVTSR